MITKVKDIPITDPELRSWMPKYLEKKFGPRVQDANIHKLGYAYGIAAYKKADSDLWTASYTAYDTLYPTPEEAMLLGIIWLIGMFEDVVDLGIYAPLRLVPREQVELLFQETGIPYDETYFDFDKEST